MDRSMPSPLTPFYDETQSFTGAIGSRYKQCGRMTSQLKLFRATSRLGGSVLRSNAEPAEVSAKPVWGPQDEVLTRPWASDP